MHVAFAARDKMRQQEERLSVTCRRNPGRMDGVRWNGDQFICNSRVEGDSYSYDIESNVETDADEQEGAEETSRGVRSAAPVVSLMDIARPAKRKGAAAIV